MAGDVKATIVLPAREPTLVRLSPLWERDLIPEPHGTLYDDPVGDEACSR